MPAPPSLPQKEFDDIQNNWVDNLRFREAHLSTRGRPVILHDSHMIPLGRRMG